VVITLQWMGHIKIVLINDITMKYYHQKYNISKISNNWSNVYNWSSTISEVKMKEQYTLEIKSGGRMEQGRGELKQRSLVFHHTLL
jgi:hypothetical protein